MKIIDLQKIKSNNVLVLFLSVLFLIVCAGNSYAQTAGVRQSTIRVTGTVTSAIDGTILPGVSIVVKGTTTGTVTGMDGAYSIEVPENATLVFSYLVSP